MDQERVGSVSDAATSDGVTLTSSGSVAMAQAKTSLFRRMLIGIKDGRFFLGAVNCVDKQANVRSQMEQRCLGMILIPSSCRTSCHVDCSVDEQLSILSLHKH